MKRAQLEVQFNWIFVLLVGGIVLGFFLIIINNQQEKATAEEATELVQRLDTVFTAITKQPGSIEAFSIPKAEIEFICDEDLSQYYIQGTGPISTTYETIFTQNELHGNRIIVWTALWEVPFEVAIFTFMSNDLTLYVFESDEFTTSLYEEMPDEFSKVVTDDITSVARGFDRYVFITRSDLYAQIPADIKEKSVMRVVSPDFEDDSLGTITFLDENIMHPYLLESLWGAIFTEDANTYTCTMNKALFKLELLATILSHRSQAIQTELVDTTCYDPHFAAQAIYDNIAVDLEDLHDIYEKGFGDEGLEQLAGDSLRGYTCPFLY